MERIDIQTLIQTHTSYTNMLSELLKSLLKSFDIKFHIVEQRTKTVESLEEKIIRKEIHNVTDEITDISGIRIILYYQDDVDKVVNLVKDNFIIDDKNSINKAELYNSNEFGYLSTHYIVTLDSKRNELPEWKMFSKLKAEVQIRTVLQHSWASISHELTYKKSYEIPKELQRKLFRLAGLFELADEQFLKIRDEHSALKQSIEKIGQSNKIDSEEINLLTLGYSVQKEDSVYSKIEKIALKAGFGGFRSDGDVKYLSELIFAADLLGYNRISEIEGNLLANIDKMKAYFEDLIKNSNGNWIGDRSFFSLLATLFLLSEYQLKEFQSKMNWSDEIFNQIVNSINISKSP